MIGEGRKRVLLIVASILAARKLANWDGRPSPFLESTIADAITIAERIMTRIDSRVADAEHQLELTDAVLLSGDCVHPLPVLARTG